MKEPGAARGGLYYHAAMRVNGGRAFFTNADTLGDYVLVDFLDTVRAGNEGVLAGRLDDAQCAAIVGDARAFVFAALEDFGIAPLEAQAAGTPVIAYREGAIDETIADLDHETPTGVLYDHQTPDAIVEAVLRFEREGARIEASACRANAARFAPEHFRAAFAARVAVTLAELAP